jgi:hypothetical protein
VTMSPPSARTAVPGVDLRTGDGRDGDDDHR